MAQIPWQQGLKANLEQRKVAGLYRQPRLRSGEQGTHVILDGKPMLSFCSNDYLGLAAHPAIKQVFQTAIDDEGVGSGAAHLLSGHSRYQHELEQALADFTGQQSALMFSTGYMANMGLIDALVGKGDAIVQDKLNHASLLDGGRLTEAKQLRYPHADLARLHQRLHNMSDAKHKLIVSDGVFSMDGDIAPLPELLQLATQHHAAVIIDDAHGLGVIGESGRGTVSHYEIAAEQAPIVVGTFGKAFGTAGAFVAGDKVLIDTLIQQSRMYIYTTAQPPAIAAATLKSLALVQEESWRREKLQALIKQFRTGAAELGLQLLPSITPIQPLVIGDDKKALNVGQKLEQQGILVGVIRSPTVPKNTARLRITLSAKHTEQDVDMLLATLEQTYAY